MKAQPTVRELEVLAACLRLGSQKMAARELGIAEATVKAHCAQVYRKLRVNSASEAAVKLRWLTLPA